MRKYIDIVNKPLLTESRTERKYETLEEFCRGRKQPLDEFLDPISIGAGIAAGAAAQAGIKAAGKGLKKAGRGLKNKVKGAVRSGLGALKGIEGWANADDLLQAVEREHDEGLTPVEIMRKLHVSREDLKRCYDELGIDPNTGLEDIEGEEFEVDDGASAPAEPTIHEGHFDDVAKGLQNFGRSYWDGINAAADKAEAKKKARDEAKRRK